MCYTYSALCLVSSLQAEVEKKVEARAAYQGWMEKKKDWAKDKQKENREREEKSRKAEQEKLEKKKESDLVSVCTT